MLLLKIVGTVLSLLVIVNSKPFDTVDDVICGYDACPAYDPDALNIHLIAHSHQDLGWLKTVDQYYFQDVSSVISSVVQALKQNKERRFVQVETGFFKKWWDQQPDNVRRDMRDLVNNGQIEIINAGWVMNDEAAVNYQSTIDQFTLGLRFMEDNLGPCARPTVGWQIDPFGHSNEQASISAHLGFDSLIFARLDYRDRKARHERGASDLLWRASNNLGNTSDIFTTALHDHYSAPRGFCFDIVCNDDPIIDDEESPDYNWEQRVLDFAADVYGKSSAYSSNNVLIPMGDDFRYEAALTTYINVDRLVEGFKKFPQTTAEGKPIRVYYSTPSCYAKAVNQYANSNDLRLEIKTNDFMPYADGPNTYWTGYFTSRPAFKRYERVANNLLQVAKQLSAASGGSYYNDNIKSLKEAIGIMQHHDAITGTEKTHVTNNYNLILTKGIENANIEAASLLTTFIAGDQDEDFGLTTCMLANVSSCPQSSSDSNKFIVAVYNPLSHTVSTPIMIPVNAERWSIKDPEGNDVMYQITPQIRDFTYVTDATPTLNSLDFIAQNLPPHGYKVYQFTAISIEEKLEKTEKKVEASTQVGYDDCNFEIDDESGLLKSVTMHGITVDVQQDFLYYTSKDSSGAYIFVPDGDAKRLNNGNVKTTKIDGDIYQGVLQDFGDSAKQIIKVYNHDRSFIEIEWVVGPLDINVDGKLLGKELISRFSTSLQTNSTFYTDSMGREMQKRILNYRPDYTYTDEQHVSGNYYPVSSKIVLKDTTDGKEFAILTDRSQGGSSLDDGEVELMLLRACQKDDGRGVGENLNEQQYGTGLIIRGRHYLILGPSEGNTGKSIAAIEREIALKTLLNSWTFITDTDVSNKLNNLQWSNLKTSLPDNVHILTLEPWNKNQLIIRLEHILEKNEDENLSKDVTVDLSDLFSTFTITELKETLLGANIPIEDHKPFQWPGTDLAEEGSNILYQKEKMKRDADDLSITLAPMQIRTYIATISYN